MPTRRSPVVAIVIGREPAHRFSVHRGYVDAVAAVGAVPLVVPAVGAAHEQLLETVARADALLLSGGGDVDPLRYTHTSAPEVDEVDPARDTLEIWSYLAARRAGPARARDLPRHPGDGRGAGGTLHQHLPGRRLRRATG